MKLTLTNGYPYPFPEGLSPEVAESICERASNFSLTLHGVKHFEWKHTVTVELDNVLTMIETQARTGWKTWGSGLVLEAPQSAADGYSHPAIIVGDTAYCGFILVEE